MDEEFTLNANFYHKQGSVKGEGDLKIDAKCSTDFLANCLYHILKEISDENREAVRYAIRYYIKRR